VIERISSESIEISSLHSLKTTQNLFSHATLRDNHLDSFCHNTPAHTTSRRPPNTSALILLPCRQNFASSRRCSSSSSGVNIARHTSSGQARRRIDSTHSNNHQAARLCCRR
jgi:hypothetical protein